ncbi:inward rectifier potassium channel 16-like [Anguilla anguilla]|uniref:inward rectifier potassium channel 16-like n=1 Tax=Anguilla anguilla TaxID=7936 RepID=UPI0015B1F0EE|nr:inward rectifier potassium channel 16-like [Anguilla anguilla]XP_035253406.1 inward rectifier potassium channel 16-like [Anguilla anguilla]XP_035253407.1 inward rectifier potassium channel 16-like [Anguilla anguilla]
MNSESDLYDGVSRSSDSASLSVRTEGGKTRRYVGRDGSCRVTFRHSPGGWGLYVTDIFTTLVESRWRVMFLIFSLSYIVSWLLFGLFYWTIALANGDLADADTRPCVENVRSFTAAFLFSLETQATIGYGFRGMTENCAEAIVVVTVQDILSCLIDTVVIGIVVAKMASARKRAQTVGFSSCAVVNLRDGVMCLSWRLGDFRGNHILEGVAQAQLIRHAPRPSGAAALSYLDLEIECDQIILATPTTLVHRLVPGSPLYRLGPEDLLKDDFEVVVTFTYTGDSTGVLHQTRTSYTPPEIRWGQRFQDMLKVGRSHYHTDYAAFHQTVAVPVPQVSAAEYDRTTPRPLTVNGSVITVTSATSTYQEAWL